jgi:hypothetical protein
MEFNDLDKYMQKKILSSNGIWPVSLFPSSRFGSPCIFFRFNKIIVDRGFLIFLRWQNMLLFNFLLSTKFRPLPLNLPLIYNFMSLLLSLC